MVPINDMDTLATDVSRTQVLNSKFQEIVISFWLAATTHTNDAAKFKAKWRSKEAYDTSLYLRSGTSEALNIYSYDCASANEGHPGRGTFPWDWGPHHDEVRH